MSTHIARGALIQVVIGMLVAVGVAGVASAADMPKADHPAPTKEMREKMATLHDQMAACLRSDKPVAECHKEMMKSCQDSMGEGGCPMMHTEHRHRMQPHHDGAAAPK